MLGEFTAADLQAQFRRLFQTSCLILIRKKQKVFSATEVAMFLLSDLLAEQRLFDLVNRR